MKTNTGKKQFFINNSRLIVPLFALVLLLVGCEKHVTPGKVERKLNNENWIISEFYYQDSALSVLFYGDDFAFKKDESVGVVGEYELTGHWSVGLDKDPTLLYIESFMEEPYVKLNDDCEVITCTSSQIECRSEDGLYINRLTLMKEN